MRINFSSNTAIFSQGQKVSLDKYRLYLLDRYTPLCSKHFIKLIVRNGKKFATYDWLSIFTIAEEQGAHTNFENQFKWN